MFIPDIEKIVDGVLQLVDVEERTPANAPRRQLPKPAFYQVQPTGTGGYKMQPETQVLFQPSSDFLLAVGAIVVHHQM
jgi:hypothetical protein